MWFAGVFSFIAAATLLSTSAAAAPRKIIGDVCRVSDPNPPLNIRTTPNGSVAGSLSNGTVITVLQHSENKQWAYVGREDRSALGWVYSELIDCTVPTSLSASESAYSVAGLELGGRVKFDANYKKYECTPSEQFEGFTWCVLKKQEREPRGSYNVSYSILHSRDGTAFYINRFQEPAFWNDNEINDDLARLSRKFGEQPRILNLPSRRGLPEGVIAMWGKVALEELDNASRKTLAADKSVKRGVLVDFIGNYTRSAREDLPLYRLTGGAGFVWIASNKNGRGTMRFLAIDPSEFDGTGEFALDINEAQRLCHSGGSTERLTGCSIIINGKGFGSKVDLATALDARCRAYNDLQEYEPGLADCNASITLHPKYSYAYANLGNSLLGLKRPTDAIAAYTKSLELKPNVVFALIHRGQAFLAVGNKEAARSDFELALKIEPSNERAKQALADMDSSVRSVTNPGPIVVQETQEANPRLPADAANEQPKQTLDSSVGSGTKPGSTPVQETNPRSSVQQEANPRPTTVPGIPSRWDNLAEFLRFFRFF
jgi:tetratricopeptide (TPR) repeat protein